MTSNARDFLNTTGGSKKAPIPTRYPKIIEPIADLYREANQRGLVVTAQLTRDFLISMLPEDDVPTTTQLNNWLSRFYADLHKENRKIVAASTRYKGSE